MKWGTIVLSFCLAAALANGAVAADALCGGSSAILTSWRCGQGVDGLCYLWGVDTAGAGRWGRDSVFAVEGPGETVRRVAFDEACERGRCSRPELAICAAPVSHGNGASSKLQSLLRHK